jgi:RecB family endonuclease NucS
MQINHRLKRLESQRGGIQCLMYLSKERTAILSDFIQDLKIPKGSIARSIDMLFQEGLVNEEYLKQKNKRKITITDFGQDIAQQFFKINDMMNHNDIEHIVIKNPDIIEEGLTILEEYTDQATFHHGRGWKRADILAIDANQRIVAIEIKTAIKYNRQIDGLKQLVEHLKQQLHKEVRGIICSKHINMDSKKHIKRLDLEYVKLPEDL